MCQLHSPLHMEVLTAETITHVIVGGPSCRLDSMRQGKHILCHTIPMQCILQQLMDSKVALGAYTCTITNSDDIRLGYNVRKLLHYPGCDERFDTLASRGA